MDARLREANGVEAIVQALAPRVQVPVQGIARTRQVALTQERLTGVHTAVAGVTVRPLPVQRARRTTRMRAPRKPNARALGQTGASGAVVQDVQPVPARCAIPRVRGIVTRNPRAKAQEQTGAPKTLPCLIV